jgi:hypothetical protein
MAEQNVKDSGRTDTVSEEVEQPGEKQPDQASEDAAMDDTDAVAEPVRQETGEQAPTEPTPAWALISEDTRRRFWTFAAVQSSIYLWWMPRQRI